VLEERKRIYPTKRLLGIAQSIGCYDTALERLTPIVTQLAKATGETVIIGKMQGDIVIYSMSCRAATQCATRRRPATRFRRTPVRSANRR
jgi:DNA-binding IclR family transcriptional regulator